jgi:hypothetical protein
MKSLERLEPDKGKQARMIKEHMAGQRLIPSTKQELQIQLEKRALNTYGSNKRK